MQCCEYQVPCQSSLNGHFCGRQVSHLTNHDNVRVLSQQSFDTIVKIELDVILNLHLVELLFNHFDGIFNCTDVYFVSCQHLESGVQSRRFTASSRPGNDDDAMIFRNNFFPAL